jgi:hypothetical protein
MLWDMPTDVLTEGISVPERRLHLMLPNDSNKLPVVLDLARKATVLSPNVAKNWETLACLLLRTGKVEETIVAAAKVLALDPTSKDALKILGFASRQSGNPEIMIPACQTALQHEPEHTRARYELAVAFAMLGHSTDARRLIDLDQFVTVTDLGTPEGYENADVFEAALVSEIARNPTLEHDPIGKATRCGLQTGSLPHPGDRAIMVILERIRCAVDVFEANLIKGLDHPFVERRPQRARLDAWAVVYSDNGRQDSHIHSSGWLSGVYYVSAHSSDNMRCGCLVLGSLESDETKLDPPWGTRDIRPVRGRLVLFPSYVPHATIPTQSTQTRICIAFDVVPIQRGSLLNTSNAVATSTNMPGYAPPSAATTTMIDVVGDT